MPTPLRRWFGSHEPGADNTRGVTILRILQSLLRQPHALRQCGLAIRLLLKGPFHLAVLVRASEVETGRIQAGVLDGDSCDIELKLVQEALVSQISPLIGMSESPRWVALHDDPFRPGAAFLRRFQLCSLLILPLSYSRQKGIQGSMYLLMASREELGFGSPLIREILALWFIHGTLLSHGVSESRTGVQATDDGWPGMVAWQKAPTALAIVSGDQVVQTNLACEELLNQCVSVDGRSWEMWLAASVRRLLDRGRNQDILPASQTRQCNLEVTLGPPLNDGESRIVVIRDATAEVLADTRQSETISTLSHELRTPLTSMKNSVSLVLRGDAGELSEKQNRFLSVTMRNIDRLDRLISDLLDASSAAAGKLALRRRVVDLGVLLREALEMLATTARQRGITLDYAGIPASFPAHVDSDKIVQMVHNTVGNALKYTEESGFVRVWIQTRQSTLPKLTHLMAEQYFLPLKTFTLVVEDNGMGMSEDVLANLFRPYRRGREAEAKSAPGTGLGLHITRGLVEAHGGSIDLTSSRDMGTTVWINLPRDPESESVLTVARKLASYLQEAPPGAKLLFLDSRRPDGQPDHRELNRATKTIQNFLYRLQNESLQKQDSDRSGWPTTKDEKIPVEEPAHGLWASLIWDYSRLGPAWEVELAKPTCPALLVGTRWETLDPPDGPDEDRETILGIPISTTGEQMDENLTEEI